MEALKRLGLWLLVALLLASCGTARESWVAGVSGTSESATHKVRTLKRLVLLPPNYSVDSSVGKNWSQVSADRRLQEETIVFLRDWKGYRAAPVAAGDQASAAQSLRAKLLAQLAAGPPGTPLPEELAAEIRRVAASHGADGVVVLGVRFEGLTAARWAQIYAVALLTIGVGQYAILDKVATFFDAAIYDGGTGALAWWARNKRDGAEPLDPSQAGRFAFDDLPNALADALIDAPDSASQPRDAVHSSQQSQ
jgi:hypothetical protein